MERSPNTQPLIENEAGSYITDLSVILNLIRASQPTQPAAPGINLEDTIPEAAVLYTQTTGIDTLENLIKCIFDELGAAILSGHILEISPEYGQIIQRIEAFRAALPVGYRPRGILSSKLSALYHSRFSLSGNRNDLSKAIELGEEVLALLPAGHPVRLDNLNKLSRHFEKRYTRFGDIYDLEKAILLTEEIQTLIPSVNDHWRVTVLDNLSRCYHSRYELLGHLEDLNTAILQAEERISLTPSDSPDRATILSTLGTFLLSKYERLGDANDLEESIKRGEEAVGLTTIDHPNRAILFLRLANSLWRRFRSSGVLDDLTMSITQAEEAIKSTPIDESDLAVGLSTLSNCYSSRYRRFGNLDDLQISITHTEEALALTPIDHPERANMLANLCDQLCGRYERLGDPQDLECAIEQAEHIVSSHLENHQFRASMLANLSNYLSRRYKLLGSLEDLNNAIEKAEQAVGCTPAQDINRNRRLIELSMAILLRHERFEALDDVERSIKLAEEAVSSTPKDDPNLATWLGCLSDSFYSRYELLGALSDLNKAIKRAEESLLVAPMDHPDRSTMLRNLSNHLRARYEQSTTFEDLERATKRANEALVLTPVDHPERANYLINLSNCLFQRYNRLKELDDLLRTIELTKEALSKTPAYHPDRADILGNLSVFLAHKYYDSGALEDLQISLRVSEEAVQSIHPSHPYRAGVLINIANQLSQGFEKSGAPELLDKAIELQEEALSLTPAENPNYGTLLISLGSLLDSRCEILPLVKDTYYAIGLYQVARGCISSKPGVRIIAARHSSSHLYRLHNLEAASSLLEEAVRMLVQICPRSSRREDLQHKLTEYSRLSSDAVSVAFQAGKDASHCLGLLELGRGIIMGLAIDCRSDISELRLKHLDLYTKIESLRSEVDSQFDFDEETYEQDRDRRIEAAVELGDTLNIIRQLPGFEGFLLPPNPKDLMVIASEGPIVIVNTTKLGSDAIIVTDSAIRRLPLPDLKYDEIILRMRQLREDILRGQRSTLPLRNRKMQELLIWLWDTVVGPVCENLELQAAVNDSPLPRIWWIGVGPLGMAPFHAAGHHSPGSTLNIASRAISSYTPTIKALSYAREGKLDLPSSKKPKLLAVMMPTTPGHKKLRGASEEVRKIANMLHGDGDDTLIMEHPGASEVLEKLQFYQAVHFSCHGVPDLKNPSNSRLLLFQDDGTESGKIDPLTVGEISSKNMRKMNSQIAYLSACSTAVNRSDDLEDEAIHIASGFQLAGFSHVLATLWESSDSACEEVAVEFYRLLFDHEQGGNGHRKVSYAFHYAVRKLRERIWRQPIIWACFIHTGA